MSTCIPCMEAEQRRQMIYAADSAGREFMRLNGISQVVIVEVLYDADEFKQGDITFCLPNDYRLFGAFYEIGIIIN